MNFFSNIFRSRTGYPPCSVDEMNLVQQSYLQLQPLLDEVIENFYKELSAFDSSSEVFQQDFNCGISELSAMIDIGVGQLDKPQTVISMVNGASRQRYFGLINEDKLSLVGAAMLNTLQHHLKGDWNEELRAAWISVFTWLVVTLKSTTAQAA